MAISPFGANGNLGAVRQRIARATGLNVRYRHEHRRDAGIDQHRPAGRRRHAIDDDTGGNALLGSAGLEINFSKVAIGFNAQLPISQNFSNQQTDIKIRGMAHVTLSL